MACAGFEFQDSLKGTITGTSIYSSTDIFGGAKERRPVGSPLTEIHWLNQFYVVELLCSVPLRVAGAADNGEKEGALPHHV